MNPIALLNNDMSTFLLASKQLFELWNDKVSEGFKNNCVEQMQRDWNSYLEAMNTRMNLFVRAERTINEEMEKYEREFKNNK
jgi:predicted DNA-binding transcriptional regulator